MVAEKTPPLTPREKLALSRLALQQSLQPAPATKSRVGTFFGNLLSKKAGSRGASVPEQATAMAGTTAASTASATTVAVANMPLQPSGSWLSSLFEAGNAAVAALERYWRNHPAKLAFVVGQPVLRDYAKKRPFTLLAAAAATGAVLVVLRPWSRPAAKKVAKAGISTEFSSLGKIGLLCVLLEVWWNRKKTTDKAA